MVATVDATKPRYKAITPLHSRYDIACTPPARRIDTPRSHSCVHLLRGDLCITPKKIFARSLEDSAPRGSRTRGTVAQGRTEPVKALGSTNRTTISSSETPAKNSHLNGPAHPTCHESPPSVAAQGDGLKALGMRATQAFPAHRPKI